MLGYTRNTKLFYGRHILLFWLPKKSLHCWSSAVISAICQISRTEFTVCTDEKKVINECSGGERTQHTWDQYKELDGRKWQHQTTSNIPSASVDLGLMS